MDIGDLDIFRDEVMAYASQLAAANISLELHVYPGVPHAFAFIAKDTAIASKALENRWHALAKL